MINIKDIHLVFNKGEAGEITAMNNLSLNIQEREFVIVLGSNGSGKSSLLNSIAGSVHPEKGSISINGNDVSRLKEFERSRFVSRIFQNPLQGTAPDLSILENFRLASLRSQSKTLTAGNNRNFKDQVFKKIQSLNMNLENKLLQPMETLSGGQRQALTLLMATMDKSNVMLLDEPAAALDPKTSSHVMEIANHIISENILTAILVTHQLKDAIKYGNRIIMMQEGNIIKDISQQEKQNMRIEELYAWFE